MAKKTERAAIINKSAEEIVVEDVLADAGIADWPPKDDPELDMRSPLFQMERYLEEGPWVTVMIERTDEERRAFKEGKKTAKIKFNWNGFEVTVRAGESTDVPLPFAQLILGYEGARRV